MQRNSQWISAEARALEQESVKRAEAWWKGQCQDWSLEFSSPRRTDLHKKLLERARRSADLADRLAALNADDSNQEPSETELADTRALLYAALNSGNPELMYDIGVALGSSRFSQIDRMGIYAGTHLSSTAFILAGCELGAACGADSALLQQNCLVRGFCGYADYRDAAYDASISSRDAPIVREVTAQIVRRIRNGQTAGMFDPPPRVAPPPRP